MDKILILDFGSQFTQLIARRVREARVYSEIHAYDIDIAFIQRFAPAGIILSGGPESVTQAHAPRPPVELFTLGIPILGICYGMQVMAVQLGGRVAQSAGHEFGHATLQILHDSALLRGLSENAQAQPPQLAVWMSHGDTVDVLPAGFQVIAASPACPVAAMSDEARRFYALQFHPEVTHTPQGRAILERFVLQICNAQPSWQMQDYIPTAIAEIRAQVGRDDVILGLSGGVDSAVAAALIHRAIGDQLQCVFVDHGLLRAHESEQIMETLQHQLGVPITAVEAHAQFLPALAGVSDPEQKRKIIGREFVHVFEREAQKFSSARWLAQGTIYPDVIESAGAGKTAHTIKSHHNVGGLPDTLNLQLLEPLRLLFKDEVRALGIALGLPQPLIDRHPFPGPGLAVRILGEVKPTYIDMVRRADAIFIEELRHTVDENGASWYALTSQAFAVFLPVKSTGAMGDGRSYAYTIALRAVVTTDFMTAQWAELPYALLARVSNRIINEVRGVNRVVYDISGKPPATIEWE